VALFPVNLRREICYISLAEQNLQYKKTGRIKLSVLCHTVLKKNTFPYIRSMKTTQLSCLPTYSCLLTCLQLIKSHLSPGPPTPSDPGGLGTATAEVREPQDGATRSPPSKADLLKMKDLILTDASVEAS
jgi:hypothetical protein